MRRPSQPVLILGVGIVLIAAVTLAVLLIAGNNDDGTDVSDTVGSIGDRTPSTAGTAGGPEPTVDLPASKYAPLLEELPADMRVNDPDTFAMNVSTFSSSYWFDSADFGQQKALEWRILDGFQAVYDPVGQAAQALRGSYYIWTEMYLFESTSGASAAFDHLQAVLGARNGAQVEQARPLGNESAGYSFIQGTVGASDMVGVYHRFAVRRGNVISVVQTYGGQPFMTIDQARDIAVIIDDKLLGARPAVEPTPIPTPSFPQLSE